MVPYSSSRTDGAGVLLRQNGPIVHIYHHGAGAGQLLAQLDGVRGFAGGVDRWGHGFLWGDCNRFRLRLRLQFWCFPLPGGPGRQQNRQQDQKQEKGEKLQKLPPPAETLFFLSGCHARFAPGGPFFFCQWGGVFAVHVCSPVFCVLFLL